MVKGVSRRVIVVDSPDPRIFEQAIFILPTDGGGVSSRQLVDEAVRIARRYARVAAAGMAVGGMGRVCLRPGVAAGCAAVTARGPAAQGRCISLLPAVSAVSALFIAAAVSSHRRKGPVFSPHLGRTRGVRPPFLPGGIVCPAPKKRDARGRLFFCGWREGLLSVLPPTER